MFLKNGRGGGIVFSPDRWDVLTHVFTEAVTKRSMERLDKRAKEGGNQLKLAVKGWGDPKVIGHDFITWLKGGNKRRGGHA